MTVFELLKRSAIVRVQNPFLLDEQSEPQPNVTVLVVRDDYYTTSHPTPADVLLVIEVADSSLAYDRNEKVPLYAKAMIPEVWLVDLETEVVTVFTEPEQSGYINEQMMKRGAAITSTSVDGLRVKVDEVFAPRQQA